jgi:hypothetical protein
MRPQPTLRQVSKAVQTFCEENSLAFPAKTGRPPILSFSQLLTLFIYWQIIQVKTFFASYRGPFRRILEEFFPKLPEYSGILKRLPILFEILEHAFRTRQNHGDFIVDSTPMKLCLEVRVKRFKAMREAIGNAVCATKMVYGFKVHILCDWSGKEAKNFCFSKGSASDASFLEILTKNCTGSGIGDSGYVSKARAEKLRRRNFYFTAKARKNMKIQNTPEEKRRLKISYRIENFIHRLKEKVGEDFSRFRTWTTAKAVVAIGIVALNLGFRVFPMEYIFGRALTFLCKKSPEHFSKSRTKLSVIYMITL